MHSYLLIILHICYIKSFVNFVGGVALWLEHRSLAGRLSLIYGWHVTTLLVKCPPHLHLTTSKVMVIVWRFRGNIIWTVLYIANVLPLQWEQLTKTVHTARLGLEFVFCSFEVEWFIFMCVYVLFYLGQLSHFLSCFGAGVTNLNEPLRVFCSLPIIAG